MTPLVSGIVNNDANVMFVVVWGLVPHSTMWTTELLNLYSSQQIIYIFFRFRGARKNSTNFYFHRYLTKDDWTLENGPQHVLARWITKAFKTGMPWPSELTLVHVTAMLILTMRRRGSTDECILEVTPLEFANALRDVKASFHTMRKTRLHNQFDGQVGTYPPNPGELRAIMPGLYEHCYPEGGPQPETCPLDEYLLEKIRCRMPARSTHASLKTTVSLVPRRPSQSTDNNSIVLNRVLEGLLASATNHARQNAVPGLTIYGEPQNANPGQCVAAVLANMLKGNGQSPSTVPGFGQSLLDQGPAAPSSSELYHPPGQGQAAPSISELSRHPGQGPAAETKNIGGNVASAPTTAEACVESMLGKIVKPKKTPVKPAKKVKKETKTPVKSEKKVKKATKTPVNAAQKYVKSPAKLPYPGVPSKPAAPLVVGKFKIYTSCNASMWRVLLPDFILLNTNKPTCLVLLHMHKHRGCPCS